MMDIALARINGSIRRSDDIVFSSGIAALGGALAWPADGNNSFALTSDGAASIGSVTKSDGNPIAWVAAPAGAGAGDDTPVLPLPLLADDGLANLAGATEAVFPIVPQAAVAVAAGAADPSAGRAKAAGQILAASSAEGSTRSASAPHFAGLGAYFGSPVNAQYQISLAQFIGVIGEAPNYIGNYMDYTQPMSAWVGEALSAVTSMIAAGGSGLSMIPVVGLPMISAVADGLSEIQNFDNIADGLDDSIWIGIVDAYKAAGYSTIALRPGFEMNGGWYPWGIENTAEAQAYVAAFQHIANVVHNIAGINVEVVWDPSEVTDEAVPAASLYPGNQYVDIVGLDLYSALWPTSLYDWSTHTNDATFAQWEANPVNLYHYWLYPDANQWTPTGNGGGWGLADTLALALANGKPFALPETGENGNGSTTGPLSTPLFPQFLASVLLAAGAPPIAFVDLWDSNSGTGTFTNGSWPVTANAWAHFVSEMSSGDPGPFANSGGATVGHGQTVNLGSQIAALIIPSWAGLTQSIISVAAATGRATLGAGGAITYVAPASGSDTVTYTVEDEFDDVASFAFAITVAPGPQAAAGGTSVMQGGTLQLGGLIAALITPGISGDTETITSVSAAAGSASLGPGGAITYVAPNQPTSDTLTYSVTDEYGDTASFAYAITVTPQPATINGAVMHFGSADPAGGTGQSDVTVSLLDSTGAVVAITTSNGAGAFSFSDVAPGSYELNYQPPSGEALQAGGAANVSTGTTLPFAVGDGQSLAAPTQGIVSSSNVFVLDGYQAVALRGAGNYHVTGNASFGELSLGNGNQSIQLTGGNNIVVTGNGNQTITLGGSGNSITVGSGTIGISAGSGNDTVHAAGGSVTISATGGGNLLDSGPGMNFLITDGSAGNQFMLNAAGQGLTTITGFRPSVGDILNVSRTLAGVSLNANLSNIGTYLTASTSGGNTTLFADPSGTKQNLVAFATLDGVATTITQLLQAHDFATT